MNEKFLQELMMNACPSYKDHATNIGTYFITTCCLEWWVQAYVEYEKPVQILAYEAACYTGNNESPIAPSWEKVA